VYPPVAEQGYALFGSDYLADLFQASRLRPPGGACANDRVLMLLKAHAILGGSRITARQL
jgi:hypothetical protein